MKIRYLHSAFIDTAQSLMHEFQDDESNTLIILGANMMANFDYDYDAITSGYDKIIVYNQESYDGLTRHCKFDNFISILERADEVWDYTEENILSFGKHGIHSKLHVLKPYMNWELYAPVKKDIDFLLYGYYTDYRLNLVNFLKQKYNVVFLTGEFKTDNEGVFGSALDDYILRSKVLLNVHANEHSLYQEQARMIKWIGAPCQIISERSTHNYINVPEMDYWELFCL